MFNIKKYYKYSDNNVHNNNRLSSVIIPAIFLCLFLNIILHGENSLANTDDNDNKIYSVEQEIKNIDQQISSQAKILNNINHSISNNNNKKIELEKEKAKKSEHLQEQKKQLIKQLQTMYIINRNNNIQKLVNIDNIQQLNRLTTYLQHYNNQNIKNINDIKSSLAEIDRLNNNLTSLNTEHEENKQKVTASYTELKKLKIVNLTLKNKLQIALENSKAKQTYYQDTHKKLSDLLVDNSNEDYSQNTISSLFSKAKGLLSVPVSGMIDINFKNKQNTKAIFIKTSEGQDVKAIFSGKVVFSDWLRGFGFLTIVNHNNGYMSLYGHNQTLFKKPGDSIRAGEVIALTGSSGGINEPGLYFEIRHNGNPVNPLAWLKTTLRKDFS